MHSSSSAWNALVRLSVANSLRTASKLNTNTIGIMFDCPPIITSEMEDTYLLEYFRLCDPMGAYHIEKEERERKTSDFLRLQIANQHRTSKKLSTHIIGMMFDCWDARGRSESLRELVNGNNFLDAGNLGDLVQEYSARLKYQNEYKLTITNESRLACKNISVSMIGRLFDCFDLRGEPIGHQKFANLLSEPDEEDEEEFKDTIRRLIASEGNS